MRQPPGRAAVFSISGKERTAFSFWSAKRICAPILFFLAEKEKNRFKKAFLWVRRNAEEAGGQSRPPLRVQWEIGEAGGQGRPPLRVRRKIVGTGAECIPLRRAIF